MRVSGLLCIAAVVACSNPLTSSAQTAAQRRAAVGAAAEEQTEPFHKHHDSRNGHDHYYPDRGAIVRDLPVGTIGTSYAGVSYRYHDGIWLEPRGPAYMVVAPPIGLVAPTLPLYSTVVTHGGDSYLYCNDTYYRPRPDLGGYEVVNDPALEPAPPMADALVGGQMPNAPATVAGVAAGTTAALALSPGTTAVAGPSAATAVVREAGLAGGTMPGSGAGNAPMSSAPPSVAGAAVPATFTTGATQGGAVTMTPTAGAVPVALTAGALPATSSAAGAGQGAGGAAGTQKVPKVFLYPKNGQSADQQAHDRYDCYRFAVAQSGFDPMRNGATPAAEQQSDFDRAQGACFEGRGYSNR